MGFLPEQTTPKETAVTVLPEDTKKATDLRDALIAKRKTCGPFKKESWAKQFAHLHTTDHILPLRIANVFNWYIANIGKEYTPQAFSAAGFRKKFLAIEAAMERASKDAPAPITPEAQKIIDEIIQTSWPKGGRAGVPNCVAKSLANYRQFVDDFKKLAKTCLGVDSKDRTILHLKEILPHYHSFVRNWMIETSKQVAGWEGWTGDLRGFEFRYDHKRFTRMGRAWVQDYCGQPNRWDAIIEQIYGGQDGKDNDD